MKTLGIIGLFAVVASAVACSSPGDERADTSVGAATAASGVTVCTSTDLAVATTKTGVVTLTKTGALYAVASDKATALTIAGSKGTYKGKPLSCAPAAASDEASWVAAGQMADYADSITGLAESIFEEEAEGDDDSAKTSGKDSASGYTVFAIETANVKTLDLGNPVKDSAGSLPGGDSDSDTLYDDDNGEGGLSAAYDLGGGDDWGEYFQGMSDGVSLGDSLGDTKATFSAFEKTKAFDGLLQSNGVSAVEVTVGQWTFFAPSDYAK